MEWSHGLAVNASADNAPGARKLFAGASCWIVTDGKAGDETQCLGLAQALGLDAQRRVVRPGRLFAALAPRGPIDPAEAPSKPGSPIAPPYPDVLIASGRRAVPYLRHVRKASGGRTFTIFLKDPRMDTSVADVVWIPQHDARRGANAIATVAGPHLVSAEALARARQAPDPRIEALPAPRVALLVGGRSRHHSFRERDARAVSDIVSTILASGASVMITPSRRTTGDVMTALREACGLAPDRAFLWASGANPYLAMLAHADFIVVTADSTNMVGEAAATAAPVFVYEPSGGHPKITRYLDALASAGRIRRWNGRLEPWDCAPYDDTPRIAEAVAAHYARWRDKN